jgi:EmrB/QacA subfamily drug resistance transporter
MAQARRASLTLPVVVTLGVWLAGSARPSIVGMTTIESARAAGRAAEPGATAHPRLALALLLTASFTLAVDFSILNVALPAIGSDVGLSLVHLQWIVTAFTLPAAGFTLLFGRVADLFGRRRVFLGGIALLGFSSLAGGLATSAEVLLAARVAQGFATAAVIPAALSLLTTSFPEGPARDRALGINGALMAAGFTTGAIAGGLLTDVLDWRWAFFVNVAVAAVVLAAAPRALPPTPPAGRRRLDAAGAVTGTLALLGATLGISRAGEHGWLDPSVLASFAGAAALLLAFLAVERRAAAPLVPLGVLRRRTVAWGNLAGILAFATETALVFLLTLYLQRTLGYSPLSAGLSFAVLGIGTVAGGLVGRRAIAVLGQRRALAAGFAVQALATAPLLLLSTDSASILLLLFATFAGGVANLVAIVAFMATATSGLPDDQQGLATGLASTSQQVGIALGIPVMSAIAASRIGADATPDSVLAGVQLAIGVDAAICAVAAAGVLWALRRTAA